MPCASNPYPTRLAGNDIRTLCVLPGAARDLVQCHLDIIRIRDWLCHPPELPEEHRCEALSYTWGVSEKGRSIRLDGQDGFPVTDNLYDALVGLRSGERPRRLWIDALCINQADVIERNMQVTRMANIYRRAAQTIVGLGDVGSSDGELATERLVPSAITYAGSKLK